MTVVYYPVRETLEKPTINKENRSGKFKTYVVGMLMEGYSY